MIHVRDKEVAGLPPLDGRLTHRAPLAPYTWFRVGGPAKVLYSPRDTAALAEALRL